MAAVETCPQDKFTHALELVAVNDLDGLGAIDRLLIDYPSDARLHFLRGSLLAALKLHDEARGALGQALSLDPDNLLIRFQLGLMTLSAGDATAALTILQPLEAVGEQSAFLYFARGLKSLVQDEFDQAASLLRQGMGLNLDNPALNADMSLLLATLENREREPTASEPLSSAAMLLQQQARRTTH